MEPEGEPFGPFFTDTGTPVVAVAYSGADGAFAVELPPGRYSGLTVEPEKGGWLHASWFSGGGELAPVEVRAGEWTELVLDITWDATF